ncbi:MAG TPA: homoserine O-acetyltransferase [Thermoanaerobaculia bacterium]|jgi:homoserine O-acetyltransferase|nr:homoserine O-acetyltransferase [Thermoanaerobaculia bacterium]
MPQLLQNTFVAAPPKNLVLDDGFRFLHGSTIAPFSIRYETFGELNDDKSNAILVCHALSASAHAAGKYTDSVDERSGWWDGLIGHGKGIDLDKYFVICANIPGSCYGTTAPQSIDPATGKPYGSRYPWPAIEDMVHSQKILLERLGITHLLAVAGGSLGGMQVLMWAACYPELMDSIITMAAGPAVPVQGIAWHVIGRKMIESDARFNRGDYYDHPEPLRGLQIARMVGHMTYLSAQSLQSKFGRRRRGNTRQFEIDSYFEYQGRKFAVQYDANSYIRVQAAMDEMDLEEQHGSLQQAFAKWKGRTLLVSFDTDWLFPVSEVERVETAMMANGTPVQHERISSPNGHDTFLIDYGLITEPVRAFLSSLPARLEVA